MTPSLVPIPRTAVVPAAGLGTRFLPATKTVPKELLPVVDTPGIELVAADAAEAGAGRLGIVTSPGKDGVGAAARARPHAMPPPAATCWTARSSTRCARPRAVPEVRCS